jgi:hypothetical protein
MIKPPGLQKLPHKTVCNSMIRTENICFQEISRNILVRVMIPARGSPLKTIHLRKITDHSPKISLSPLKKLIFSSKADNFIQKALHLVMTSSG